ncbi:hypothetical protein V1525DRAFT_380343 [Lipomyces kononenkoae]|uniref:Uncharacterized protein n=1 Tax=Lipomyces kononenkoae TaxID=34357 RepID=A0ACC3SX51_LIPKO
MAGEHGTSPGKSSSPRVHDTVGSENASGMEQADDEERRHTRHKRTRSGCYTCRKRRVKCDETRPICNRCRKGDRECHFPPERVPMSKKQRAQQARKLLRTAAAATASPTTTREGIVDNVCCVDGSVPEIIKKQEEQDLSVTSEDDLELPTVPPEQEQNLHIQVAPHSNTSTSTPNTASTISGTCTTPVPSCTYDDFSNVPPDIANLFRYHRENITHCHYFLSTDPIQFFDKLLMSAHTSPPLMYAFAAFTSYHYALRHGERYLEDMFGYYEDCVKVLISAIENPDLNVMIAILILSCVETYLGDVSNEIQHQDAVFNIFESLYTPETAFETDLHIYFFVWLRFIDIRRSIFSGRIMALDRKWHGAHRQTIHARWLTVLTDIDWRVHSAIIAVGNMYSELCDFAANVRKNLISGTRATRQIEMLRVKGRTWFESLDPELFETVDPPDNYSPTLEDMQLAPPICYKYWQIGFLCLIFHSWKLYFSSYSALSTTGTIQDPSGTSEIAVLMARIFSGLEAFEKLHPGTSFAAHNYLCLAASFMPHRLHGWMRRKMAQIQAQGYNFPEQIRIQIASTWNNDDLYRGWLEGIEPEQPAGVAIPWKRLLQVKIPELNLERQSFTAAVSEMRGVFDTGVTIRATSSIQ